MSSILLRPYIILRGWVFANEYGDRARMTPCFSCSFDLGFEFSTNLPSYFRAINQFCWHFLFPLLEITGPLSEKSEKGKGGGHLDRGKMGKLERPTWNRSSQWNVPCCISNQRALILKCNKESTLHQAFCISQAMMVCLQRTTVVTEPTPAGTGDIF